MASRGWVCGILPKCPTTRGSWEERYRSTRISSWRGRGRRRSGERVVAGCHRRRGCGRWGWRRRWPPRRGHARRSRKAARGLRWRSLPLIRVTSLCGTPCQGPDVWRRRRSARRDRGSRRPTSAMRPVDTTQWAYWMRMSGMRWPIEMCFEDGKQPPGMGDYEVRSWTGWHHHMTLVILAHFFVVRMSLRLKKTTVVKLTRRGTQGCSNAAR